MATIHPSDPNCPLCNRGTYRTYSSTHGVLLHCDCGLSVPLRSALKHQKTGQSKETSAEEILKET